MPVPAMLTRVLLFLFRQC